MKTIKYFTLAALFCVAALGCKGKDADSNAAADSTAVTPSMEPVPDMATDTSAVDTVTDSNSPGVTKGEMEQVP
jgi:hypothetical protein